MGQIALCYIAGPFRGPTPWAVEQNVRKAEAFGLKVAELGGMPIIPHTNTRFFDKLLTDEFWIEGTKKLLERCDCLVLTPEWARSTGSRGEKAHAIDELGWTHEVFDMADYVEGKGCLEFTRLEHWLREYSKG